MVNDNPFSAPADKNSQLHSDRKTCGRMTRHGLTAKLPVHHERNDVAFVCPNMSDMSRSDPMLQPRHLSHRRGDSVLNDNHAYEHGPGKFRFAIAFLPTSPCEDTAHAVHGNGSMLFPAHTIIRNFFGSMIWQPDAPPQGTCPEARRRRSPFPGVAEGFQQPDGRSDRPAGSASEGPWRRATKS
jgi:hypothetical protein